MKRPPASRREFRDALALVLEAYEMQHKDHRPLGPSHRLETQMDRARLLLRGESIEVRRSRYHGQLEVREISGVGLASSAELV
jgi:hypothetical protein